jgi:hypothetical protein
MPILTLEYPNGRTVKAVRDGDVKPGEEFDLYGRRWKVIGRAGRIARRYKAAEEPTLLCRPTTHDHAGPT